MNNHDVSPPSAPSRRNASGWEIVCPDGGLRHFPYATRDDAEFDATLCAEEGCQIFPESTWLEPRRPTCMGGPHRIVVTKGVQRDAKATGELGRPASP